MTENKVRLRRDRICREIENQELKLWWVAEVTGVHKTTLRRWLSGRISKVRHQHARRLAETLSVSDEAILLAG